MAFIDSPNEAAAKICQDSEQNFFAAILMLRESTLSFGEILIKSFLVKNIIQVLLPR